MGKSVIAAVICERMNLYFAGCHFFSHKDFRYRDPKIFLQSLAVQLCDVLPEYKNVLLDQLSRNIGSQNTNEMNIEGLFTLLLKEPFAHVSLPGKNFLFVVDAVEESCDTKARSDLVDLIATHLVKLPKFIRFLITTRPEKNIVNDFEPLGPFFLKSADQNNVEDLKIFFESKLSPQNASTKHYIDELTSTSDGNMLFAHYVLEIFNTNKDIKDIKNLAIGLKNVFKIYFERLEKECNSVLNINDDTFLTLLCAIVASREPLPLDFVVSIFGIKRDTPSARRNAVKAMDCISLLFVIKRSRVSFFHKSVRDWLVSDEDHFYKVNELHGHVVLAKLCTECIRNALKSSDLQKSKLADTHQYALQHGIYHMIKADTNVMCHINVLKNLEIIYCCASSVFHFDMWARDLIEVIRNSQAAHILNELNNIISQFLTVYDPSIEVEEPCISALLQTLMINMPRDISFKALELYGQFHPELPYFIKVYKHDESISKENIVLLSKKREFSSHTESSYLSFKEKHLSSGNGGPHEGILTLTYEQGEHITFKRTNEFYFLGGQFIDVSSRYFKTDLKEELCFGGQSSKLTSDEYHLCSGDNLSSADVRNLLDYVVLCFESGIVVIISLKPFKVIWAKTFAKEEISCSCIAFHPHHDVILPGRVDQVLSLREGSWKPGPFSCQENYFFNECCFSPDNSIMITGNNSDKHLVLWDLISGEKKKQIDVKGPVSSFSFSPNGNYFAVLTAAQMPNEEINCFYFVFNVSNNYTLHYPRLRQFVLHGVEASLTGCKSGTWLISGRCTLIEVCADGRYAFATGPKRNSEGKYYNIAKHLFFPSSKKTEELLECSITSQIIPNSKHFHYLWPARSPFQSYLIVLHDMLHLSISYDLALTLEDKKFTSGNISFDRRYFYRHCQ